MIESGLAACPALPSLASVNEALRELLDAEQSYSSQISEVIRRDPSLTARLLRLVNSVYYGLSTPATNLEDAVFYLGVRQIRQLALVTPIIEDFGRLTPGSDFPWREFWQHCLGTAILTREIIGSVQAPMDETDYIAGLVHDVGKIVMARCFPQHFGEIHRQAQETRGDLLQIEREVLGIDHGELGAMYLRRNGHAELLAEAAQFHHHPEQAAGHRPIIAAIQIADLLMRHASIGCDGSYAEVTREECSGATGWRILYPTPGEAEESIARAAVLRSMERLPATLEGLV